MKRRGRAGEVLGFLLAGPSPVLRLRVRVRVRFIKSLRLGTKYWREAVTQNVALLFLSVKLPSLSQTLIAARRHTVQATAV